MIDVFGGNAIAKVLHYYGQPTNLDKIVCPFHDDINPSMKIDFGSGKCYCFGCNESYTTLSFVKRAEELSDDLTACIKLVRILGSSKVRKIRARNVTRARVEDKQALIMAEDYYYGLKTSNWEQEDGSIVEYMLNRGFTPTALNMAHVKYTYNTPYPLVFPIMDNNDFRGWVCRTTIPRIEKKRKYLYNEGFSRATTLCGRYENGKTLVLVEGYMDMLKLKQFGLQNVVALLGWKITSEQVTKLKAAGITTVISALDADECGNKGSKYLESFFNVIRFQYPEGTKDTGDLTHSQFKTAMRQTKNKLKDFRRSNNGTNRRYQKSGKTQREQQKQVRVLQG